MKINVIKRLIEILEIDPALESDIVPIIRKLTHATDTLTPEEQYLGTRWGKIKAIRCHQKRVGCSLVESRDIAERYFEENGLTFYKHEVE
jgi:hypothetical protein